jgi:hypothetical protein
VPPDVPVRRSLGEFTYVPPSVGAREIVPGNARRLKVLLCFIGLDSPERCDERVAMRVLQGRAQRAPPRSSSRAPPGRSRILPARSASSALLVFDSALLEPFRKVAEFELW